MSDLHIHYSRCPVVKTETMTLWQYVEVGGSRVLLDFKQEVLWLRESEADLVFCHRRTTIKRLHTSSDFYDTRTIAELPASHLTQWVNDQRAQVGLDPLEPLQEAKA